MDADSPGELPPPQPEPGEPERLVVTGAAPAAAAAASRSLLVLRLSAAATAAAQKLAALAQPLGADTVLLTVSTSGELRASGTMSYVAEGVRLTHPARPLETASLVSNSLVDGSYFDACLALSFGAEGRSGMADKLRAFEEHESDIRLEAEFGPRKVGQP